ncbi:MAG: heme-binding domain-containing protein [Ignavibacteriaceae bacterium]
MKIFLIVIIVLLIGIQFIPVDRSNPPVIYNVKWDSQQTQEFAQRACYDCHSNETNWPWYSYTAPASWFLASHVSEGREHMNFSTGKLDDAGEAAEEVELGKMPLKSYLLLHGEADLTEEEKKAFIAGLKKTFGSE